MPRARSTETRLRYTATELKNARTMLAWACNRLDELATRPDSAMKPSEIATELRGYLARPRI